MQRIGFVVLQGTSVMGFAGVSAFEFANILKGDDIYDVHFLSEGSIYLDLLWVVRAGAQSRFTKMPLNPLLLGREANRTITGTARICAASAGAVPAHSGHLHWRLRAGRGGPARRAACDHPLAPRARNCRPNSRG